MPTRQRQDHIYKRAYELAASGVHINPITIVSVLVSDGYPEAAELLNSDIIRSDLREVCTRHWKGVTAENPPLQAALKPPYAVLPGARQKRPSPDKR